MKRHIHRKLIYSHLCTKTLLENVVINVTTIVGSLFAILIVTIITNNQRCSTQSLTATT